MKQFSAALKTAQATTLRVLATEVLRRVILRTPVDTGRARSNWQVGINTKPNGDVVNINKSGSLALETGTSIIKTAKYDSTLNIMNNLPYIEVLEAGSSNQAPSGFVSITTAEFGAMAKEISK